MGRASLIGYVENKEILAYPMMKCYNVYFIFCKIDSMISMVSENDGPVLARMLAQPSARLYSVLAVFPLSDSCCSVLAACASLAHALLSQRVKSEAFFFLSM